VLQACCTPISTRNSHPSNLQAPRSRLNGPTTDLGAGAACLNTPTGTTQCNSASVFYLQWLTDCSSSYTHVAVVTAPSPPDVIRMQLLNCTKVKICPCHICRVMRALCQCMLRPHLGTCQPYRCCCPHAACGDTGAGAVHKSPELRWGEARLVLTVDDACCRQ
jgi:hypothetical protein